MSVNPNAVRGGNSGGGGNWKQNARNTGDAIGFILSFIPTGKLASVLTWVGAVTTSYILIESVVNRTYWSGDLSSFNWDNLFTPLGAFAVIYQFIITILQRGYWSGDKSSMARGAMMVETITNAAAVFPYMLNIDVSGIWLMFESALPFWPGFNTVAALALSLGIGYIMAGAPEYLWKRG